MKDLKLSDTGGHYQSGERIANGHVCVYMCDGEIAIDVTRSFAGGTTRARSSEAYLSVEQAGQLRKHLKRLIDKATA